MHYTFCSIPPSMTRVRFYDHIPSVKEATEDPLGPYPERLNDTWRQGSKRKHVTKRQSLAPVKNVSSILSKLVNRTKDYA